MVGAGVAGQCYTLILVMRPQGGADRKNQTKTILEMAPLAVSSVIVRSPHLF